VITAKIRIGEPDPMGLVRPFPLGTCGVQAHHRKGLGLSLEELVVGGEGNHGAVSILFDDYLFQG
jgi:hypothetical protein